jgi:hypothetical protein
LGEEIACGGRPIDLQRRFGTLIPHAEGLAETWRRFDANRVPFGC